MPIPNTKEKYTYQDYLTWPDGERWEIIDGMAYNMAPAPTPRHQDITANLFLAIGNVLHGKKCRAFFSPIDVVLSEHDVVQPDLLVVCDPAKIGENYIQGAPDMVIEILSPSTSKKDRWQKKNLYERSGVKEYVIVDPVGQYVEQYLLQEDGGYNKGLSYDHHETMTIHTLENLQIPVWEVFGLEKPSTPGSEERG